MIIALKYLNLTLDKRRVTPYCMDKVRVDSQKPKEVTGVNRVFELDGRWMTQRDKKKVLRQQKNRMLQEKQDGAQADDEDDGQEPERD